MMDYINNNLTSFWLATGFMLLALEVVAFGFATGVLLFGSIGALVTGGLLWMGVVPHSWLGGIAAFTVSSVLSAIVLWKPFQRMQSGAKLGQDRSSDLIGYEFRLEQGITLTQTGRTRYSGIDWRVEIQDDDTAPDAIAQGQKVRVTRVEAGVFYVLRA